MKQKINKRISRLLAASMLAGVAVSGLTAGCALATSTDEITVTYPYYAFVEDPENPWSSVYDALDSTGEIQYGDSYFEVPSPGDHAKLRAASYALALAGYENQADGYPADPSRPNQKIYGMLSQMGFSDFESWDVSSEEEGHSMGTTIGHKTLSSGQELIVVAPRNYNYMTEWLSNFNVGTSGDHAGFSESASLITSRFNQYITSHNFKNYKVWAVGYSRGGAVIDLFAKAVNANISSYDMHPDNFYVYTFGAPRASVSETNYANIHDVKDGNDLLLGYLFPETWGFYNTGVYEEVHPADLAIKTAMIDISDLADGTRAMNLLATNQGLTKDVSTVNGKDFMDAWTQFVTDNGLTREYFNAKVKPSLSALMQLYQLRTLDKQSEFIDFLKNTDNGLAAMVAGNALADLISGGYSSLDDFPPYQDLVKVLRGTATDADIDDFVAYLSRYIGNYADYEARFGEAPKVTGEEFAVIKDSLPKLVKALAPVLVADARYTQATYGENYSLFYTYSLISNAEKMVVGHIPESIMPILKSLIHEEEEGGGEEVVVPNVPDSGYLNVNQKEKDYSSATDDAAVVVFVAVAMVGAFGCVVRQSVRRWHNS